MTNYEKMLDRARTLFLTYDQNRIIEKWNLNADDSYIYFSYIGNDYRLDRKSGNIDGLSIFGTLAIYDLFCNEKDNLFLAGKYCTVDALRSKMAVSGPGSEVNEEDAEVILKVDALVPEIVKSHGGKMLDKGDLSFSLPITSNLDLRVVIWRADEDFSANLQFFFDENILSFFRYETLFYIMSDVRKLFLLANNKK